METALPDLTGIKVMIYVPTYSGSIPIETVGSIIEGGQMLAMAGAEWTFTGAIGGSLIHAARNRAVATFLQSDFTHLLFLDDDVLFHPQSLLRLVSWAKTGCEMAMALYRTKRDDIVEYRANPVLDKGAVVFGRDGYLTMLEHGPAGFFMISREVFETLIAAYPEWYRYDDFGEKIPELFYHPRHPDRGLLGEDYAFCELARKHGFQIYADHSIPLGHLGRKAYWGKFSDDYLKPMVESSNEPGK